MGLRGFVRIVSVIICFTSLVAIGQEKPLTAQEEAALQQRFKSKSLRTIKSDFVQEKHLEYLASTVISKGKFWFRRDNKLRWEYTDPFKFLVVMNNGKITTKDEKNTSVYKKPNKTFEQLNKVLVASVNGELMDNPQYRFEPKQTEKSYVVHLFPNDAEMKNIFKKITILFTKSKLAVSKVKMVESGGDVITITYKNMQVNTPIGDGVFVVK